MGIKVRDDHPDAIVRKIAAALEEYNAAHPGAKIDIYRQNSVSVRIRILNRKFAAKTRAQREDDVWACLDKLPQETAAEISLLLLLTPNEAKDSLANVDFENPIPSRI